VSLEHARPDLFRGPDVPVGVFVVELFSPNLWTILTLGGLDFAVLDLEHSRFTTNEVSVLAASAQETSIPLIVRTPQLDPAAIGRLLDLGAAGVMVSRIETAADAENLVQWAKFAPRGSRNAAFAVAHDRYRSHGWAETAAWANERTMCIAMIETAEGARNAEEICAVPDLDAVWLGPADLTQSLGRIGDLESPEYREAEESVLAAAAAHGLRVGIWARTDEEMERQLRRGYGAIAVGTDTGVVIGALQSHVARLREVTHTVANGARGG
jgi:2-keto-3-deoxy-L-rhamnonate aldolase RhmA